MKEKAFSIGYLILAVLVLGLTACAGPQTKDFAEFANSGIRFTEQTPKVYDYAFRQEVNADSAKIISNRELPGASGELLAESLEGKNTEFLRRLDDFNLMKKHAILMRSYFMVLGKLASGENTEEAGNAAASIANQMENLVPQITKVAVLGKSVTGLLQPFTKITVGAVTNAALKKHLEQHGDSIRKAIDLQREMFQILRNIEIEQDEIAGKQRAKLVLEKPLKNLKNDLPANWSEQRLALLTVSPTETPLSAALQATQELQENLRSLALNQGSTIDRLERSILWMNALIDAFEKVQGGAKP